MICLRLASSILASFKISFSTFLRSLGEVEVMDLEAGGDWYQAVLCIGVNELWCGVVTLMWSDMV